MNKTILKKRNMGEYEIRHELVDMTEYMGPKAKPMEMRSCYSTFDNSYMGNSKKNFITRWVRNYGLSQIQSGSPDHNVATIGYCERWPGRHQCPVWVGWSHRAVCAFGIGDKLFEEDHASGWPDSRREKIPFIRHGRVTIKNMEQAKQAAINFADYVG